MSSEELQRGYRLRGHVQGVGFRWWTRSQAQRLGVTGFVRNARDGSVEVQARGHPAAVSALERLLGQGPPGAEVTEIEPITPAEVPRDGFAIRH